MEYTALLAWTYSGSTLLSMLVTSQPQVVGFGDTYPRPGRNYDDVLCTCGALLSECPARSATEAAMRARGYEDFGFSSFAPYAPQRLYRLGAGDRLHRVYEALAPGSLIPGTRRFVQETNDFLGALADSGDYRYYFDGSKYLSRAELLSRRIESYRVIHLIRDPRRAVYSAVHRHGSKSTWKAVLQKWIRYNQHVARLTGRLGDTRVMRVTYEELINSTEEVMPKILRFIGLESWRSDLGEIVRERTHVVGSNSRLKIYRVEKQNTGGRLPREIEGAISRSVCNLPYAQPYGLG